MNTDRLRELMAKLSTEANMCSWASIYSMLTWNKIGFTRSVNRGRIYETSLTQDLVFQFYLQAKTSGLPIEIFEAWDETTNGNDLDFFIQKDGSYVHLPVQAKLIGKDGRYTKIRHHVSGVSQLDALMEYAKKKGGVPLYLLYNHAFGYELFDDDHERERSIEEYGCSLIHADYIKQNYQKVKNGKISWIIPRFEDLHRSPAFPLSELFCGLMKQPLQDWPGILQINRSIDPARYTYDEITNEEIWRDMTPPGAISGIQSANASIIDEEMKGHNFQYSPFDPKYRIIFSLGRRSKGGLY